LILLVFTRERQSILSPSNSNFLPHPLSLHFSIIPAKPEPYFSGFYFGKDQRFQRDKGRQIADRATLAKNIRLYYQYHNSWP